jgi:putative oxidoreductase
MNAKKLVSAIPDRSVIIIRMMVGAVFLSEGLQKFLFAAELGAGRFAKLGLPYPEFLGPFVGATEIICAVAVLLGARIRIAVIPLLVVISVAIVTTKWPMLRAHGFWAAAHDGRTDFCMLAGLLFLLSTGAGRWSVDRASSRANGLSRHDGP